MLLDNAGLKFLCSAYMANKVRYGALFLFFVTTSVTGQKIGNESVRGDFLQHLTVSITDSTSEKPTPVRVKLTRNKYAVKILPRQVIAVMYGLWDHADGYGFQPDSAFYVDGTFEIELPEGEYSITLSKGLEYLEQHHTFKVSSVTPNRKTYRMRRWIDMPSRGWYSADDHIHIRRSPREDSLLMKWIQAEDIHVGVLLKMGDFWATYYDQYGWGDKGVYSRDNYFLTSGQEDPRTPEVGHALGFGGSDPVRYPNEYYYYDKVFDRLHELGGVTGYAHQAESFHGYRGLMLDGLRRKIDILELLQFCISANPLQTQYYYHLLDLGYAVTAVAGSDFPWCGKDHTSGSPERNARIGNARFYTYLDAPLSLSAWKEAVRKGHTFVTSGPMIKFSVNDQLPGDTLHVKKDSSIKVIAEAYGRAEQVPLEKMEIILHGKVMATVSATQQGQSSSLLSIHHEFEATRGFWIAVRAYAGQGQAAHTTPVYVDVDNKGFHNAETLTYYLDLAEQYLEELRGDLQKVNDNPELQGWRYRKGIEKRIADARAVIQQLRSKNN
jgi:hypothetical protein